MDSASAIAAAVTAGRLRAAAVLAAHESRDRETHQRLNALVQRRPHDVAADAAAVDAGRRGGLLAGVPVSVKECFPVRGLRTTLGIEARRDVVDRADAPFVAALSAAGALVVGKGNVPQAMSLHETDNPVWGRTCHPLAADRSPGGSSGGDAALVAAGVVPLAVGNDLAGSLRQPAHACGIATLMPRSAVIGEGGAVDVLPHLRAMRPRAGFLARDVADLRLALAAVAPAAAGPPPAASLRVGWWDHAGPIPPSAAVTRAVSEAVARLERSGSAVVSLDPALAEEAAWLHLALIAADGGDDLRAALAGSRRLPGVRRLLAIAALPRAVRPAVAALVRLAGRGLEARALLATGRRSDREVAALLEARDDVATRFKALVAGCDAIVCPVSAVPALRHGTAARLVLAAAPCLLANLLDLAAGAVPVTTVRPDEENARPSARDPVLRAAAACDRGSRGLPVGVQVVACPGRGEATVLDVMELIERGACSTRMEGGIRCDPESPRLRSGLG